MFEFAALTYGLLASFVMASVDRNRRTAQRNPPVLMLFGYVLMAFSATVGAGLLAYTSYHAIAGTTVVA